jgi:hypothetical protein
MAGEDLDVTQCVLIGVMALVSLFAVAFATKSFRTLLIRRDCLAAIAIADATPAVASRRHHAASPTSITPANKFTVSGRSLARTPQPATAPSTTRPYAIEVESMAFLGSKVATGPSNAGPGSPLAGGASPTSVVPTGPPTAAVTPRAQALVRTESVLAVAGGCGQIATVAGALAKYEPSMSTLFSPLMPNRSMAGSTHSRVRKRSNAAAELTARWRRDVWHDCHVQFYMGCTVTGLFAAVFLLAIVILPQNYEEDGMSPGLNLTSAFPVLSFYTSQALLIHLLNQWAWAAWAFHWRHSVHYAIVFAWVVDLTANIVSLLYAPMPDSVTPTISAALAAVSCAGCVLTAAITVPADCRQMQLALAILALADLSKVILVNPDAQQALLNSLNFGGYTSLWGAAIILPLYVAFVTVHWQQH